MSNPLELVLLLLASAVLVVVLARSLQLPPMLGYLLVGVAIGPHALQWIPASKESGYAYLAEFGVVFLMFSIGLEFSLPKLFNMRRVVFGLGMGRCCSPCSRQPRSPGCWVFPGSSALRWEGRLPCLRPRS